MIELVNKLSEQAEKILAIQIQEVEKRYKGISNLLKNIEQNEDIAKLIYQCSDLIKAEKITFSQYRQVYFYGSIIASDCVFLFTYNLADIETYENDTPETTKMREQKLEQYKQTQSLSPSNISVIRYLGSERGCYDEVKETPNPDIIYCLNGLYRMYHRCKHTFEYKLCRMIAKHYSDDNIGYVFKILYLYTAMLGEQQKTAEEMLLMGYKLPTPKTSSTTNALNLPKELNTPEFKKLLSKLVEKGFCSKDGNQYKWIGTAGLFGYFVDTSSKYFDLRPSNDRIPWRLFTLLFQMKNQESTAKQCVNDYSNKDLNPPDGYKDIDRLMR